MSTIIQLKSGELIIHAMPAGRALAVSKAVKVGNRFVFLGADGKIYCPAIKQKIFYSKGGDWHFLEWLMPALIKLKVVTKEQVAENVQFGKDMSAVSDARHALRQLDELKSEFGLKVSNREIARLEKIANRGSNQ